MIKRHVPILMSGLALGLLLVAFRSLALAQEPVSPGDADVHISTPVTHVERQELINLSLPPDHSPAASSVDCGPRRAKENSYSIKLPAGRVVSRVVSIEPIRLQITERITTEARMPLTESLLPEAWLAERDHAVQPIRREFKPLTGQVVDEAYPIPWPVPAQDSGSSDVRPAAVCVVNSAADSGSGTLRHCLENAMVGDTITFDVGVFPPTRSVTIPLASALPWIITDSLTIDASDAGVVLDGSGLSSGAGFVIAGADEVKIRGLQIVYFPLDGVAIIGGATNTMIGGDRSTGSGPLGRGNLISGNGRMGVWVQDTGTMSNTVLGNYIGTDASGTVSLANAQIGVFIGFGATNNAIGGDTPGARNLVSGNRDTGVWIQNTGTVGNYVVGNYIGTDVSGNASLGNEEHGVLIGFGATNNTIGGDTPGARNLISGNGYHGVYIGGSGASGNQVLGNYIGTNISGTAALGNTLVGVVILDGATDNTIGGDTPGTGNLISGNELDGIFIQDSGTSGNQVMGNYIGTDVSGNTPLGNRNGVVIHSVTDNTIGGDTAGKRNLISGNRDTGVWLQEPGTSKNRVFGNYIGTNISGTSPLGNSGNGVFIGWGAMNNIVGGYTSETRNLISGNGGIGVFIQNAGTMSNTVLGNYIGTDVSGTAPLANTEHGVVIHYGAMNNTIGGDTAGAHNLISGNGGSGVRIEDVGTSGNQVLGNNIGTDVSGTASLANVEHGVAIYSGATDNVVGGAIPQVRNLISGNGQVGVLLCSRGTSGNQVLGNYIGTDASGTASIPNLWGVFIGEGATNNIVGGTIFGARNLISGNEETGVRIEDPGTMSNTVLGNYIGTDVSGTVSLPNEYGVAVTFGAMNNTVGGDTSEARNLISGNGGAGVVIWDAGGTAGNQVLGNYIGTDVSGTAAIPNYWGVYIASGGTNNVIGADPDAGNLISGNDQAGVWIQDTGTSANQVPGNYIGANAGYGVFIGSGATHNTIGISNTIVYNALAGVVVSGTDTLYNTVTRNVIHDNGGLPIDLVALPSPAPPPPVLNGFSSLDNTVWGATCPGCRVEIFANPTITPAGTIFLADVETGASGYFSLTLTDSPLYPYLATTVTDPDGTTSEFSDGFLLAGSTLTPASATVAVSSSVTVIYTHTLTNVGPYTDTFTLSATSDQGWLEAYQPPTVTLTSGITATVIVTITVPDGLSDGMVDRTVITATSGLNPQAVTTAEDITVFGVRIYLPLIVKNL